jgi:hypothetical protein
MRYKINYHSFYWVTKLNSILFIMICLIITISHVNCIVYKNNIV